MRDRNSSIPRTRPGATTATARGDNVDAEAGLRAAGGVSAAVVRCEQFDVLVKFSANYGFVDRPCLPSDASSPWPGDVELAFGGSRSAGKFPNDSDMLPKVTCSAVVTRTRWHVAAGSVHARVPAHSALHEMETGYNAVSARLKHRCLNVSRSLAVLAAAFPLVGAIGWYADVPVLRSLHPALPAMQPNTALALLLAAIATPFVGDHRRSSRRFSVPAVIGLIISLIGLITLVEYHLLSGPVDRSPLPHRRHVCRSPRGTPLAADSCSIAHCLVPASSSTMSGRCRFAWVRRACWRSAEMRSSR